MAFLYFRRRYNQMNKRLLKILIRVLVLLALFLGALYLIFNSAFVQTKLTQAIGKYLGDKWNTTVTVDRVHLEPFRRFGLDNLYIEDQHGDTLIFTSKLFINFKRLNIFKGVINIKEITLNDAHFYLRKYEGEDDLNLAFILDTFKSSDTLQVKEKTKIRLSFNDFELNNAHFIYQDQNVIDTSYGMHYSDLDISNINGLFSHVSFIEDSIHFHIESLNAEEKCGLVLKNLISEGYLNGEGFDLMPLHLKVNSSLIDANQLTFKMDTWSDFQDFVNKVQMTGDFQLAKVKMEDIAFFAPSLEGWKQEVILIGKIKGKVNNLTGRNIILKTGEKTSFEGNFNIDGLPDFNTSFITLEAKELNSVVSDLENIQLYPFKDGKLIEVPKSVKEMGVIKFKGDFTGFINDFVAYGELTSERGKIITDISLKQKKNKNLVFSGKMKTIALDLGVLIGSEKIGKLDCNVETQLYFRNGAFVKAEMNGKIDRIGLNDYDYRRITLNGLMESDNFTGNLSINDPSLDMDFLGLVKLSNDSIVLNFNANLLFADMGALNILPINGFSSLSAKMDLNLIGKEWTGLIGSMDISDLEYCTDSNEFSFGEIFIRNDTLNNNKTLFIESDIVSGEMKGEFDIPTIKDAVMWEISKATPSYFYHDPNYISEQDFDFNFVFHDISFLQKLNIVDINVSAESNLYGKISPAQFQSYVNFDAENVDLYGVLIDYPDLYVEFDEKEILIEMLSEGVNYKNGPEYFPSNTLTSYIQNDTLDLSFQWLQSDSSNGQVHFQTVFIDSLIFEITSDDSKFTFLEKNWHIGNNGKLLFNSNSLAFENIRIATDMQSLELNGMFSKGLKDTLNLKVNNFELSNFNYMLQQFDYKIGGWSNGSFNWITEKNELRLEAELEVDSAIINDYYIGDISVSSKKSSLDSAYQISVSLRDEKLEKIKISGTLNPDSESELMNLEIDFNRFNLDILNYTKLPGITDVKGSTKGKVKILGDLKQPRILGEIEILDGGLFLDVLGTHFTFDTKIDIYEDYIALDPFDIYDLDGKKGTAYGTILHEDLKKWNYDFSVELEDFLVMDLKNKVDALFYGKAYATGYANIWGYNKLLFIDVVATTKENTQIFIPIKESNTVDRQEFIEFVRNDSLMGQLEKKPVIDISGVEMNLDIKVTPEAEVQLIFDEDKGDVLKVASQGKLVLNIDKDNGFTMVGSLETYKGEYVFTLESIINKKFDIPSGSKISWLGNPYDANIDILAVYRTRASLAPIMVGQEEQYKSRVNTDVSLFLKGNLQSPDISFKIDLPDSEEREKTALRNATSTTEDLNKQMISLLLFNSFQSVSGWDESGGFASANTFELLSNQVSNWLSQISDEVDINVNYRPSSSSSGQELDVGLTTDILDERVSITTQVGFKDATASVNPEQTTNNIVGDFIVEYKLTEDGRIRLKAFNKSNDNYQSSSFYKQAPYTQGVGIIFRRDFDNKMKRNPSDNDKLQSKYDKWKKKE